MDWIALEGLPPWDGRYPLDPGVEFSTREWGWIKRLTGYLPLTVDEAFQGGDAELYAVLALIAMHRAGKVDARGVPDLWERLQDAPLWAKIRFESDDQPEPVEEADAGPPPGSSPASEPSSGGESTTSSGTSPSPVNGSGTPDSAISVYDPATWQT